MAVITNLTTLTTAVTDYLARADLASQGFVPNFIQQFEDRFYRDPENWASWMETALSVTLSNNVAAVPASYLGLRIAYFSGYTPLKRITLEQMYARYPRGKGTAGVACHITRNGANFEFGPETQSGTLLGTYYAKPTKLRSAASDAASHFLITDCADMCLYGALLEAEPFVKNDARIPLWKMAYDIALDTYRRRFREESYSSTAPFTVVM